jgi:hypothetical protein
MRYIPMSSYSFDEIVDQCRQAVLKAQSNTQDSQDLYTEIRKFYHYDEVLTAVR